MSLPPPSPDDPGFERIMAERGLSRLLPADEVQEGEMSIDPSKMSDDEIVALFEQIRGRASDILAARHAAEFLAARDSGHLYVAHYHRYGAALTEEFLTPDEAVGFLRSGEDHGELSSDKITGPGGYILEGRTLSDHIWPEDAVAGRATTSSIEPPPDTSWTKTRSAHDPD